MHIYLIYQIYITLYNTHSLLYYVSSKTIPYLTRESPLPSKPRHKPLHDSCPHTPLTVGVVSPDFWEFKQQ